MPSSCSSPPSPLLDGQHPRSADALGGNHDLAAELQLAAHLLHAGRRSVTITCILCFHSVSTRTLKHPHFIEEETGAWRDEVISPARK